MRKIAANYIFLPGYPLIKNGYVVLEEAEVRVVDTGGCIREIAGMEFYGGLIVPDYVMEYRHLFHPGDKMLSLLEHWFAERGNHFEQIAIIEGADLLRLTWSIAARIRLL